MSVQKIPLDSVQKIRQHIKTVLELPEGEKHPRVWASYDEVDELPEPDSLSDLSELFNFGGPADEATYAPNAEGRWFISSANPGDALMKLPGIKLKPDFRFACYLYRAASDGMGITWALPEMLCTTAQLEKALSRSGDRTQPPQPEGAMTDAMEALEGDRSPASYIIASILRRELREMGAMGKFRSWSHHRLIDALPNQVSWEWKADPPRDWSPKVKIFPDGKVAIEFFTCRVASPVAIFQHIDQYPADGYKGISLDRPIAMGHKTLTNSQI